MCMYLRAYIAVAETHAGDGEWEGGNDGGGEAVRGRPIHGLVSSPAHQLRELGTQAYTDIKAAHKNRSEISTFLLMESKKIILNTHLKTELSQKNFLMKLYVTQTSKFKAWSPAQLISWENLEPRPIRIYRPLTNFDLLLMESQHLWK